MMWEYKMVQDLDQSDMNQLGAEGWELVAVTETWRQWENERKGYTESETDITFYFKRKVE
jgi:hypothetical protein